jgi:hypothetical protein
MIMHFLLALVFTSPGVAMQRRAPGITVRPLVYKHMSRTGGSFTVKLLEEMLGSRLHFVDERRGLTDNQRGSGFVVAGVRNPCDYYVSLYAADSETVHAQFSIADGGSSMFQDGNTNATKFAKWLNFVQGQHFSIMSYRFWETLIAKRNDLTCYWGEEFGDCLTKFDDEVVDRDLAAFNASATADCWVHTESLMDDLESCLHRYESVTQQSLNWTIFSDFRSGKRPEVLADAQRISKRGNRLSCSHYYNDNSASSVLEKDRHIFRAFGYDTCCGPHSD